MPLLGQLRQKKGRFGSIKRFPLSLYRKKVSVTRAIYKD